MSIGIEVGDGLFADGGEDEEVGDADESDLHLFSSSNRRLGVEYFFTRTARLKLTFLEVSEMSEVSEYVGRSLGCCSVIRDMSQLYARRQPEVVESEVVESPKQPTCDSQTGNAKATFACTWNSAAAYLLPVAPGSHPPERRRFHIIQNPFFIHEQVSTHNAPIV